MNIVKDSSKSNFYQGKKYFKIQFLKFIKLQFLSLEAALQTCS